MTRRAGAATALLLALAVAGCGSDEPESGTGPARPTGAASGTVTGTASSPTGAAEPSAPTVDTEALERDKALAKLAIEAQEQAARLRAATIPPRDGPVVGADVSWPQCPAGMGIPHKMSTGAPMPGPDAEYVVIGLTNGPGFHPNPCLADQVTWARENGLLVAAYSVISWPDGPTQRQYGGLREAGYAQAEFNLASMKAAGLESPIIWLDIESVPFYDWSKDTAANAEVVVGAVQGYLDAGYRVGVYSTPHLWTGIVGDLQLGVPEWRAAGKTSREEAERRCGGGWVIQGGEPVLAQWVEEARDKNVSCPGVEARLGEFFTTLG